MTHRDDCWHNESVTRPLVLVIGRNIDPVTTGRGLRTAGHGAGRRYSESIVRAGGIPLVLPPLSSIVDRLGESIGRCDAVVLHGGGDIDPAHYGQEIRSEHVYGLDVEHDEVELAAIQHLVDRDTPTLAICRGAQIVNVALGGTLAQHIDGHRKILHPVTLEPESRAAVAMRTDRPERCHSFHHQAIERLGDGLVVTGRSDDGVVEAVEVPELRWMVGVQWHPEDTADDDPEQQRLFDALIDVATGGR